jgi:hypothetical protein
MPAGPVGSCWVETAFPETVWEDGSWGESESHTPHPDVTVRVRGQHAVTPAADYTILDGGLWVKDPSDAIFVCFDWDAVNLAASVTIEDSDFRIEALDVDDGSPSAALTSSAEDILSGARKTLIEVAAGTVGALYRIDNTITTTEGQVKERSIFVRVEQR